MGAQQGRLGRVPTSSNAGGRRSSAVHLAASHLSTTGRNRARKQLTADCGQWPPCLKSTTDRLAGAIHDARANWEPTFAPGWMPDRRRRSHDQSWLRSPTLVLQQHSYDGSR